MCRRARVLQENSKDARGNHEQAQQGAFHQIFGPVAHERAARFAEDPRPACVTILTRPKRGSRRPSRNRFVLDWSRHPEGMIPQTAICDNFLKLLCTFRTLDSRPSPLVAKWWFSDVPSATFCRFASLITRKQEVDSENKPVFRHD